MFLIKLNSKYLEKFRKIPKNDKIHNFQNRTHFLIQIFFFDHKLNNLSF